MRGPALCGCLRKKEYEEACARPGTPPPLVQRATQNTPTFNSDGEIVATFRAERNPIMKTLIPAGYILFGAVSLAAFAAQSAKDSGHEIIGRIPAESDVVLEWNAEISDHFEEFSLASTPHIQAHVYAMVHLAMRDAIAATTREARDDDASTIAKSAASAAAHDILVALRPAGVNRFASLQARQVAAIADDTAAFDGRHIGKRIAASVLSGRAADGWPIKVSRSTTESAAIDSLRRTVAKPTPFVLKRVQQFEPEPPYFAYGDGVVMPNLKLRNKKFIGTPDDVAPAALNDDLWRTETIVRWNRAGQSLAVQQPQDLHERARLFAALNTALADALLSATYWGETYSKGRAETPTEVLGANDASYRPGEAGDVPPHPAGPWWVANRLSGFPAIPAALAGAAEAILRSSFSDEVVFALPANASYPGAQTDFTSLQFAARRCAWAALGDGASTPDGCVAGYDLGSRIAGHLLKQSRR
jgi:hypothetical protein